MVRPWNECRASFELSVHYLVYNVQTGYYFWWSHEPCTQVLVVLKAYFSGLTLTLAVFSAYLASFGLLFLLVLVPL